MSKRLTLFLFLYLLYAATGSFLAYGADNNDTLIKSPFRDVLSQNSLQLEKQIVSEMLGAITGSDFVYRDDSTLLHDLREYQKTNNIPVYDYQYCLAGPMTLNLLIKQFIANDVRTGNYHRELYMRSDPAANPGATNISGTDIVEFQLMYNTWTEENGRPLLLAGNTYLLVVDGYYGKFSRAAAGNFQKSEPLLEKKDGIVDAKTWKLLYVRTYLSRNRILKQLLQWSTVYLP